MATSRPNRASWARYTSPMPPAPRGDWISYGPSLVPEIRAIGARNYSLRSTLHADGNGSGRVVGYPEVIQSVLIRRTNDNFLFARHSGLIDGREALSELFQDWQRTHTQSSVTVRKDLRL